MTDTSDNGVLTEPTRAQEMAEQISQPKKTYPSQTKKARCPVCKKPQYTRDMGNHLRQVHKIPVPARQRDAHEWAANWIKEQDAYKDGPRKAPPAKVAAPAKTPAPPKVQHDVIPTSEDVTIAIVRSLFDGDFPIKHLRAIMHLETAVSDFLKEIALAQHT